MDDAARDDPEQKAEIDKVPALARFKRLFGYARPYFGRLGIALAALMVATGLGLTIPEFFGQALDAAFTEADESSLDDKAVLLLAVVAAQAVFVFLRHYLMSWVGERVVVDLRIEVYEHLVRMPQAYFRRNRTGELLSRLADDVTRLQDVVGQDLSMALRNALTLIGGIVILFVLNWKLTAMMLAVVPPVVIASTIWGRILRRLGRAAQDQLADASGGLQEGIAAIETVQAFTREQHEVDRYGGSIHKAFALFVKQISARSWFMAFTSFISMATIAAIFWVGGRMVISGTISAGELSKFFFYTLMVAGAVGTLSGLVGRYYQVIGSTARIFEILDAVPAIRDADDAKPLPECEGHIAFEGVSFTYEERDAAVISNVDLRVDPGQVVALVGPSGSGKTTLGRLVQRFWDPDSGRVTLDGQDLRDLALQDLRRHMALVSQDPILFSGSIRDNLRYGRLDATDEEVEAAARAANAHDFVTEFPQGYDTLVGERGIMLSGGQRQRLSIARAILRDPKVLILDEATSALDSESEHLVQAALEKLQKGRTTLVIAHRLSTIRDADTIVVLDGGRVVEKGTHGALMQAGGAYARLVHRQAGDAEADLEAAAATA